MMMEGGAYWYEDFKSMIWIVFGLGCLWFMRKYLGVSPTDFIKTIITEFNQLKSIKSERGAVNMFGGFCLMITVVVYLLLDNTGKFFRLAGSAGAGFTESKLVLLISSLLFVGGYFLLCVKFILSGRDLED